MEYGQRPVFSYRSLEPQDGGRGELAPMLYSPFRQNIKYDSIRPEDTLAGNVISFRNRETGSAGAEQANAGYYYVGLGMPQGDEDRVMGVEQPFEIAFDAVGEKADGPEWRPTDKDGPEPSDTPPDTGEKKDSGEEKSDESDTQALEESDDAGFSMKKILLAALGLGIVVLLAAIAIIVALVRRK